MRLVGLRRVWQLAALMSVLGFWPQTALAHPHIWVSTHLTVVFAENGQVAALRNQWTFDAAFSAWAIQGLDTNGDGVVSSPELQELADEYISGLAEYGFYTYAGETGKNIALTAAPDPRMFMQGDRLVLDFSVVPAEPLAITRQLEVEVSDPEYYVEFTFPETNGARLVGAPQGCAVHAAAPRELAPDVAARLAEIGPEQRELPPELKAAVEGLSNKAVITCPSGALGAGTLVEQADRGGRASPFGAPPAEISLPLPKSGFLGWINQQQKSFYAALTAALGRLKTDGSAFWWLGGLSFLYGIFHAAGPGHGKFVISSYVLAERAELWRGIGLSFVSALMQSLVAIAFVLGAAAVLDMTAMAMSGAFLRVEQASYVALIAVGAWLLLRRFFAPHNHEHEQIAGEHAHAEHLHGHASETSHDHAHKHLVTPSDMKKGWQAALGVVAAVGLRPCSGALIVLVFALSQGLVLAGIGAVLLMGVGTGITVAALASFAVLARAAALRVSARGRTGMAAVVGQGIEVLGALGVLGLGAVLLAASLL